MNRYDFITLFLAVALWNIKNIVVDGRYLADNFLVSDDVDDQTEEFVIRGTEYLFVSDKMLYEEAMYFCDNNYDADLAIVKDLSLAKLLAEALAETNLLMDSLWIAAIRERHSDTWWWKRENYNERVRDDVVENFTYNTDVIAHDRNCLAFGRTYHDIAQFRPLTCRAKRSILCERPASGGRHNNSTHPGWIKIGRRKYKIFNELVSWKVANDKCYLFDNDATLAVIVNYEEAQVLGRYLLIGRPSLEKAWIGAKWMRKAYEFEEEELILDNKSDSSGYPPWRYGFMTKPDGCILLDRHLSNIHYFIETNCESVRGYICYKIDNDFKHKFTDVFIGDRGYRLHYNVMNWFQARDFCKQTYANYSASLVEIRESVHTQHLLYVMGENKTSVSHIWIAGMFNRTLSPPSWFWDSDKENIPTENNSVLNWVKNATYVKVVEQDNVCLTMDRENHILALHYGTICRYEQSFVCLFTADNLRRLETDEKNRDSNTHHPVWFDRTA